MGKKWSLGVQDGKLVFTVDSNEDGEAVVELKISLTEIPDEVIAAIKAARAPKAQA